MLGKYSTNLAKSQPHFLKFLFETESFYAAQAAFTFLILSPQALRSAKTVGVHHYIDMIDFFANGENVTTNPKKSVGLC